MGSCCTKNEIYMDRSKINNKNSIILLTETIQHYLTKELILKNGSYQEKIPNSYLENDESINEENIPGDPVKKFSTKINSNFSMASLLSQNKCPTILDLCVPLDVPPDVAATDNDVSEIRVSRKYSCKNIIMTVNIGNEMFSELNSTNNETKTNLDSIYEDLNLPKKREIKNGLNSEKVSFIMNVLTDYEVIDDQMDTDIL